mmetsp:Transcript_6311/g.13060  ORF Transcript_6311/g.13060 Transcript_6311/m.13060 type:complete len:273 (-) Transcript_6311:69-887(-)
MASPTLPAFKNNELLVNYHDAVIYGWELKLIERRTEWLNDSCIHFFFTHLQQYYKQNTARVPLLFMEPSVVSFWMHQCVDQDEIDDFVTSTSFPGRGDRGDGILFVAVNDQMAKDSSPFLNVSGGGNHWSLLVVQVVASKKRKTDEEKARTTLQFWHFDSVRNSGNRRAAEDIAAKINLHVYPETSSKEVRLAETPQQENGYDCGVHVLGAAKILSKYLSMTGNDNHGSDSRLVDLEQCLRKEMGTSPQKFCSRLRHEISSEIRRLYNERNK